MRIAVFAVFLAATAHAAANRTPEPTVQPTATATPAWHTPSGFPEDSFKGVEPREITGLLTEQLAVQGFEPIDGIIHGGADVAEKVTPSDDYHSAFIKKDVRWGIQWVAVFNYLTLPKRVKVIAKPDIISLGILLPAKPGDPVTAVCNTAMLAAKTELEADK